MLQTKNLVVLQKKFVYNLSLPYSAQCGFHVYQEEDLRCRLLIFGVTLVQKTQCGQKIWCRKMSKFHIWCRLVKHMIYKNKLGAEKCLVHIVALSWQSLKYESTERNRKNRQLTAKSHLSLSKQVFICQIVIPNMWFISWFMFRHHILLHTIHFIISIGFWLLVNVHNTLYKACLSSLWMTMK